MYKCPVCQKELLKHNNTYKCLNGHSFDVNKKQFVNLLLPNQIHSDNPGDNKEMIEARTKFLNQGYYEELRNELKYIVNDLINDGDEFIVCHGGRGGRGNRAFATQEDPAPKMSEYGEPGEERIVKCELKVLADVG